MAQPRIEIIKKVLRPNLSAKRVVQRFPVINMTASAIDDKYASNLVPVFSRIYTAYVIMVKQPVSWEK